MGYTFLFGQAEQILHIETLVFVRLERNCRCLLMPFNMAHYNAVDDCNFVIFTGAKKYLFLSAFEKRPMDKRQGYTMPYIIEARNYFQLFN